MLRCGNKVYIGEYLNASGTAPEDNPRIALGIRMNGGCSSGILTNFAMTNTAGFGESTYAPFLMPDGTVEMENSYLFGQKHWSYDNMEPENSVDIALPSVTPEEHEEASGINAVLMTCVEESMAKFYQGEMDIDSDAVWAEYVAKCKACGSDRLCEICNSCIVGIDFAYTAE